MRRVVEERFVDGAELLDAEIAIRDPLAPSASAAGRVESASIARSRGLVVQIAALGERRARRREQAAVERGDLQIAGAAAGVREARDRAQGVPELRRAACGHGVAQPSRL